MRACLLLVPVTALAALASCKSSTPAQPVQNPQPVASYPYPTATAPTPYPTAQPTATAPYPTAQPTAIAPPAQGGQAIQIPPAGASAATSIITGLAASQLPAGMQPAGAPFAGQFTEGQTLTEPLTLMAGKCYSIVAAGVGITEIHVTVMIPPLPAPAAQDTTTPGPTAILGPKSADCWRNVLPIAPPAQVVITATHGSGIGVAQVYMK